MAEATDAWRLVHVAERRRQTQTLGERVGCRCPVIVAVVAAKVRRRQHGLVLHAVTVRSVKLRAHDDDLRCDRLRGIGYAWRCSCGERGRVEGTHNDARLAGRAHVTLAAEDRAEM